MEVQLSSEAEPTFPDLCLVCGAEHPGEPFEMVARGNHMQPYDTPIGETFRRTSAVPVCAACVPALVWSRRIGKLLTGVSVLVGVALLMGAIIWKGDELLVGWQGYATVIGCIAVPIAIRHALHSPHFDFRSWDRRVIYEFRDKATADLFAQLNAEAIR